MQMKSKIVAPVGHRRQYHNNNRYLHAFLHVHAHMPTPFACMHNKASVDTTMGKYE